MAGPLDAELLDDNELAPAQVDVNPPKAQQLAPPQPRPESEVERAVEPVVSYTGEEEEAAGLVERPRLLAV